MTERMSNTLNAYLGSAKQSIGETTGNRELAASGAAQKTQAEESQRLADADTQTKGLGHSFEGQAQEKIGSLTGDKAMQARGVANQALGDAQQSVGANKTSVPTD
ncbi:hypothetical protein BC939DRAFT_467611 [Gamsiella multidivaricata]|uniref:uncharacterized protein n=1 Tax=Gamsiella multidivaricata TaxID=101098 RepID=UPI00221FF619|nr:uncharacterized protein BC939DRAFT_467611 [Gamsiella multidivaricata]KAG0358289.1 hypothetical protein BGZ54_010485 [Gamsiella multidivaricata]KAI7816872.1 hypothetical protein BC939DRAFT_467611 [Gamsiella multidivaricata]